MPFVSAGPLAPLLSVPQRCHVSFDLRSSSIDLPTRMFAFLAAAGGLSLLNPFPHFFLARLLAMPNAVSEMVFAYFGEKD